MLKKSTFPFFFSPCCVIIVLDRYHLSSNHKDKNIYNKYNSPFIERRCSVIKTKKSKAVLAASIISTLYLIYLIIYFANANTSAGSLEEEIGAGIATALVLPHMFILGIGVILNWIGYGTKKNGFNLAAAILYCVSAFVFLLYAIFLIPSIMLGFVGYNNQGKINKLAN